MSAWIEVTLAATFSRMLINTSDIEAVYDYTPEIIAQDSHFAVDGTKSLIVLRTHFDTTLNRVPVLDLYERLVEALRLEARDV